ncbi:MAG: sigma-70 family RNA polymerase sigma factor [Verrucomicrobiota bacterium]
MGENSPQSEELFVSLFADNERHLRAFVRSMGLDWSGVDEVVQTVSLVMWRKWEEFDPDTDFLKWGRVIARFEVLRYRRNMARDRHVFSDDLIELLGAEDDRNDLSQSELYRRGLQACLEQLPDKSRRLVADAYAGDRTIGEVASSFGKTATAFYKTLNRIRQKLQPCIEQKVAEASQRA